MGSMVPALPLTPTEAARVSDMLDREPAQLAETLGCSPAQARSLQQYVLLAVVVAFRRSRGEPCGEERARASLLFRCMPGALRLWLGDAFRFAA